MVYYEGNDIQADLVKEIKNEILINYLNPSYSQNLLKKQNKINNILENHINNLINLEEKTK